MNALTINQNIFILGWFLPKKGVFMHFEIILIHHPHPERDSRCFVFGCWEGEQAPVCSTLLHLEKADPNNNRKKKWRPEQQVWREWRSSQFEPQKTQLLWFLSATKEFSERQLRLAQKKVWLLGWDPLLSSDVLRWHWSLTGPASALSLFEAVLNHANPLRTGWTIEDVRSRTRQALQVVIDSYFQAQKIYETDLLALPKLLELADSLRMDSGWRIKRAQQWVDLGWLSKEEMIRIEEKAHPLIASQKSFNEKREFVLRRLMKTLVSFHRKSKKNKGA